ncbi:unnamed protein product [Urochloa decumbens]|uniref:BTB domain-containing protein n=1 Tax=Urochloa decumbens TaxID=240449 RepID=A0ABC9BKG0_9POAL
MALSSSYLLTGMPAPTTFSSCALETEQGRHLFRVVGYSQQRERNMSSGIFIVGGHRWALSLAIYEALPDHIFVALVLCDDVVAKKVQASYELNLVDHRTGLSLCVHKEAPMTYDTQSDDPSSRVSGHVKRRSVFESPNYLHDDCLTVECIVTVILEKKIPETKLLPRIEVPPYDIAGHFGKLLETSEGVDVTFSVDGVKFTGHKVVLAARSLVFKAELYGPMREAGTEPIVIKGMQPDVFRALMHFIYNDSLPPLDDLEADDYMEMVRHLLVAADRYAMERLKLMCQSILCENLGVQTVATTLALADQHNCDKLKDACIEFMASVMDAVMTTQGYMNLKRTCPSVAFEALEKTSRIHKAH